MASVDKSRPQHLSFGSWPVRCRAGRRGWLWSKGAYSTCTVRGCTSRPLCTTNTSTLAASGNTSMWTVTRNHGCSVVAPATSLILHRGKKTADAEREPPSTGALPRMVGGRPPPQAARADSRCVTRRPPLRPPHVYATRDSVHNDRRRTPCASVASNTHATYASLRCTTRLCPSFCQK